jgi:predicted nucleic acid-binding protein
VRVLVDTNVLSEARRSGGHAGVKRSLAEIESDDLFMSVISIGEIAYGIARLAPGAKRRDLLAWLSMTQHHFADHILPIDGDIARLWGDIAAKAAKAGRTLHAADGLIAATALHHGLRLMTRNARDYEATGVPLHTPWDE